MTGEHERHEATVPPLSGDHVRILRAWCESEPEIEEAWVYGSHIRGRRRDPSKAKPSDIDLAIAFAQDNPAQHSADARREPLVRLRESLKAFLAPYPSVFGSTDDDADFVELRVAFEGSQVKSFLGEDPSAVCELFNRRRPIRWPHEQ